MSKVTISDQAIREKLNIAFGNVNKDIAPDVKAEEKAILNAKKLRLRKK